MTIQEQVAQALEATNGDRPEPGQLYNHLAVTAINAFLKAAAKEGRHIVPVEATEAMIEAGIANTGALGMITSGPDGAFQLVWRAMVAEAPKFELD